MVKYADFVLVTRSKTLNQKSRDVMDVQPFFSEFLEKTEPGSRKVRLLGVSF